MSRWAAQNADMTDKQSVRSALENMGLDYHYVLFERDKARSIHFYPGLKQHFRQLLSDITQFQSFLS